MFEKMKCHISDGPQEPEDLFPERELTDLEHDELEEQYRESVTDELLDLAPALSPGFMFRRQAE